MTTPIPHVSPAAAAAASPAALVVSAFLGLVTATEVHSHRRITYSSWLTPSMQSLRVELRLMKALLEDTSSLDLNERVKVWLNQMQELSIDLDAALDEHQGRKGLFYHFRLALKMRRIAYEIRDLSARKLTYGIGNALGEAGLLDSIAAVSFGDPSFSPNIDEMAASLGEAALPKNRLARQVKSLGKELQIVQALLQDVNGMEILDPRLKLWVEEMQALARESTAVMELDTNNIPKRFQAVRSIKRIRKHFLIMSRWKNTYDIGDIKSRRRHVEISRHSLEERGPFPSNAMEGRLELLRREIKLMQALDVEMNDLDATSVAWVEEMRNVAKDANNLISNSDTTHSFAKILSSRYEELDKDLTRLQEKITQLSEIRVAYGIEFGRQKLPPRDVMPGLNVSNSVNLILSVPSYLRQCLYYFLLFPANFEVPVRRLIVLWVAEGLVHSKKNGNESAEHIAVRYLEELILRGIVHVTKKKLNGKVKSCQLNDDMRDTWLNTAKEARFFEDTTGNITRLIDHHGNNHDSSFIRIHGNPSSSAFVKNYRNVLSFLSFDTQEGSKPGQDIGDFLNKCILAGCFLWLRVLDLERVFRPKLPKAITRLTQLRYLGLRWTYLEDLPKYVSMLFNLQVIDVKHTYISILPKSIWTMQYLRHLYLSETYHTRFSKRPSHISLNELQTLWGAFIDENTSVKEGLNNSLGIRKLGLSWKSTSTKPDLMSEKLQDVAHWISKLEFLETLRLKSRDEFGKAAELHLNTLETNSNLSTVYLLGKLRPSVVATFPGNLIEITLSGSELNGDPMEYLGKLQKLIVLRLLSRSVLPNVMHCSQGSFPKLKVLKIWELENLEKWEGEEGALPCLEDLEIRLCKKLKRLPQSLQHVDTLQKFRLTRMTQSFVDDSKALQPEVWAKIEDVLEVVEEQQS